MVYSTMDCPIFRMKILEWILIGAAVLGGMSVIMLTLINNIRIIHLEDIISVLGNIP